MKHFINILVILILTGFAIGLTHIVINETSKPSLLGILYLPLAIFMFLWGIKLSNDYNK